ncbi:MAG: SAM-dependent methyltransferase [Herbinix sp.]|nr:SAM-dependent methyltransferase [Herbinix sp.]
MSYFDYERIAKGYAENRPQFHLLVMDMLLKQLEPGEKLKNGLDVGCGAGLSASALQKVCEQVIAADASWEMIQAAKQVPENRNIRFIQCAAEELDFEEDSFDIVTVAGAINWIKEEIFLPLVHGFLKNDKILLIYDNTMSDKMEGVEAYTKWWSEQYLRRFPKPPRKENIWRSEDILQYGFQVENRETYQNQVLMDQERFINYMVTQSNVIARVEEQGESLTDVREWFNQSLEDIFKGEKQSLVFEGYNWYLKLKKE